MITGSGSEGECRSKFFCIEDGRCEVLEIRSLPYGNGLAQEVHT